MAFSNRFLKYIIVALALLSLFFMACQSDNDDSDGDGAASDDDSSDDDSNDDDDNNDDDNDDSNDDDDDDSSTFCDEEHPDWTVGLLFCKPEAYVGYTLMAPMGSKLIYLIDIFGRLVHSWKTGYFPGLAVYLLEDGTLLRTRFLNPEATSPLNGGGAGGGVARLDWDGNVLWEYIYYDATYRQHHDVELLPNGNILMIAWEYKTGAESIAAGRDPNLLYQNSLWPDHVIEVEPTGSYGGNIVWEWHVWDHLIQDYDVTKDNYGDVAAHPELIDLNYTANSNGFPDFTHINSIEYNEKFDQIILSAHEYSEVWIIDHSTTTAEAAGHTGGLYGKGGDLLYRWGNPRTYRSGTSEDQKLFSQHHAQWIEDGMPGEDDILVFNNGVGRPEAGFSSVDQFTPPVDEYGFYSYFAGKTYDPDQQNWVYMAKEPKEFYSINISGTHRLANGNTIICNGGNGNLFEVTPEKEIVWYYINPVTRSGPVDQGEELPPFGPGSGMNNIFRVYRYSPDYPGFEGKDLTPGDYIEGSAN